MTDNIQTASYCVGSSSYFKPQTSRDLVGLRAGGSDWLSSAQHCRLLSAASWICSKHNRPLQAITLLGIALCHSWAFGFLGIELGAAQSRCAGRGRRGA